MYGVKVFRFKLRNIDLYTKKMWAFYFCISLCCGFLYFLIIGTPFWLVCYYSVDEVLDFKTMYKNAFLYLFFGGLGSWGMLCIVPCCGAWGLCDNMACLE